MEDIYTLHRNSYFLKQNKDFEKQWFLIGSKFTLENALMVDEQEDGSLLIPLSVLTETNEDFTTKIKNHVNSNLKGKNNNYFVLVMKIVSLTHPQKREQLQPKEIITSSNPSEICQEFLNILSLIFGHFFEVIPVPKDYNFSYSDLSYFFNENISNFFTELKNLREEQYNFLMKSYSLYNKSLQMSDNDIPLAIILLVTLIENLSNRYEKADNNHKYFDKNIKFHQRLNRIINRTYKREISNDERRKEMFEAILESYNKFTDEPISKKFLSFIVKHLDTNLSPEDLEEIFKQNLYDFRSRILHQGQHFFISDKDTIGIFNISVTKPDKYLAIPTFNSLKSMVRLILLKFTDYLYKRRDEESDKHLYFPEDTMLKFVITRKLRKGIINVTAGYAIRESELEPIPLVEKIKQLQNEFKSK